MGSRSLKPVLTQIMGHFAGGRPEERTGATYFKAEVSVPRETLEQLQIANKITPGIPADLMIVTKSRTILAYLIQPLRDSMRRAFKEAN